MQNLVMDYGESRMTAFLAPTLDFESSTLLESVILRAAFLPSNPLVLEMPATLCPEEYGLNEV